MTRDYGLRSRRKMPPSVKIRLGVGLALAAPVAVGIGPGMIGEADFAQRANSCDVVGAWTLGVLSFRLISTSQHREGVHVDRALLATAVVAALPSGGVEPQEKAAYDALLAAQALAADKTFFGAACDGAKVEVVSIMPWKIAAHPELVVWREKVRVTGCGHSSVENVNVGRVGGTPP